ncbi:MAG: secretin N-terminal domain-containing protein [Candidatus Omnitrophica bacterium]|nr:secretin N-terminal domain-containing protein [Candidatus Omnitrophota bacterium]
MKKISCFLFIILFILTSRVFSQDDFFQQTIKNLAEPLSEILEQNPVVNHQPESLSPSDHIEYQQTESLLSPNSKQNSTTEQISVATEEDKVYLDFRDADIREVSRVLSKISGKSILVSEDVQAKVTLNIEGVTWKRALELILRANSLSQIEKDDFIIIVTYKKIQEERNLIGLKTEIITLNFVNIADAKNYLRAVMTQRGTIDGDQRTNSLIVTDTPEVIENIDRIVKKLDVRTPQVLIEVLMVDKKCVTDFDFGIDWSIADKNAGTYGNDGTSEANLIRNLAQDLDVSGSVAASLSYGKTVFSHYWLKGLLEVWQEDKLVNIIANPKILTLDNITAKIDIAEQVPYTQTTSDTTGESSSTQFKDIGVAVDVKPHITNDGHVIMEISTEQSFLAGYVGDTNEPQIDSRKSNTTMMVRDNETIVIGGLRTKDKTITIDKIPLLGDIPLLGRLFTRTGKSDTMRELLIFVTPMIVKDSQNPYYNKQQIKEKNLKQEKYEKQFERTARGQLPGPDFNLENHIKTSIITRNKAENKRAVQTKLNQERTKPDPDSEKEVPVSTRKNQIKNLPNFSDLEILPLKRPDETF